MNTVIAVLATDVPLDKAATRRMAMVAHDGLARAIDPIHTLVDGDSIFALSTYDTDYMLVRDDDLERAVGALRQAGHTVEKHIVCDP